MVLSPVLVITVIIMEISQQAPEASPLWFPHALLSETLECGAPNRSEPVVCRGEPGWGGGGVRMERGSRRRK